MDWHFTVCSIAGPQKGIIFLVDMAGGKLLHLSKIKLKTLKMGLRFAMDGCPQKIIAFHILNAVPFYELIMQLMRPFARKELKLLVRNIETFVETKNFAYWPAIDFSWIFITPTSIGRISTKITFHVHAFRAIMVAIWSQWKN